VNLGLLPPRWVRCLRPWRWC